ncbi:MAG: hypothetical protein JEY99_06665 [Spirochaetales bacterium]|nr:hypothetical protein [Spirochaetales bacterium]
MKQKIFILLIIILIGSTLAAETFRLGGIGTMELMENPLNEETRPEFEGELNMIPGFYWEVKLDNIGFGMTYLTDFTPIESDSPDLEYEWYLDWIGSFDFRYHFLGDFAIDPFVELGIGNAGRVELTEEMMAGEEEPAEDPLMLSLFIQAGGGAALRLGGIHVGAKVLYRVYNQPIPATQIEIYPLKNFELGVFGGFSF